MAPLRISRGSHDCLYPLHRGAHDLLLYETQGAKGFLEKEYNYYRPRYEADSTRLSEIRNNPELIERIAREKYYMHAPGEELFVIAPPEQTQDK